MGLETVENRGWVQLGIIYSSYTILFCNTFRYDTFLDENTEVWAIFKEKYRFD